MTASNSEAARFARGEILPLAIRADSSRVLLHEENMTSQYPEGVSYVTDRDSMWFGSAMR